MLRGVLIGFFIASLFGVPSQSIAIVMTFWVFVFWLSLEATPVAADTSAQAAASQSVVIAARADRRFTPA